MLKKFSVVIFLDLGHIKFLGSIFFLLFTVLMSQVTAAGNTNLVKFLDLIKYNFILYYLVMDILIIIEV